MKQKIQMGLVLTLGLVLGSVGTFVAPQFLQGHGSHEQPYKDEQGRSISSLSAKDVEQLRGGQGWGLAKPAEFNGYPGPAHILEFADRLTLNAEQKAAVDQAFLEMREKAKKLGAALIDAEKNLDTAFVEKDITLSELDRLLGVAEKVRAQLRSVHLAAHLRVTPLLSDEQKEKYASLRGYNGTHGGH